MQRIQRWYQYASAFVLNRVVEGGDVIPSAAWYSCSPHIPVRWVFPRPRLIGQYISAAFASLRHVVRRNAAGATRTERRICLLVAGGSQEGCAQSANIGMAIALTLC